jgi:phosphoribosyl 1,2-cyclic phosphodiesterase
MKLHFWGVRGFYPVASAATQCYGGNTAAIEVISDSGSRLLVDLGTGAIPFGRALMAQEFGRGNGHLSVLLTHTHLDHTAGLPFFVPAFIPGNKIDIYGAASQTSLRGVLDDLFDSHVCPINSLDNLGATLTISDLCDRDIAIGEFRVQQLCVPHGHGSGAAWRVSADGRDVVLMTGIDHPTGTILQRAADFARGADLLLHDCTWKVPNELKLRWGGSTLAQALEMATVAQVKRLCLTHHAPGCDDEGIVTMLAEAQSGINIPVMAAAEGHDCPI